MCLPLRLHFHGAHVVCLIAFLPHNGHVSGLVAFGDAQGAVEGVEAAEVAGHGVSIDFFKRGLITEAEGNAIWQAMLNKRRQIGVRSFTEYLKNTKRAK